MKIKLNTVFFGLVLLLGIQSAFAGSENQSVREFFRQQVRDQYLPDEWAYPIRRYLEGRDNIELLDLNEFSELLRESDAGSTEREIRVRDASNGSNDSRELRGFYDSQRLLRATLLVHIEFWIQLRIEVENALSTLEPGDELEWIERVGRFQQVIDQEIARFSRISGYGILEKIRHDLSQTRAILAKSRDVSLKNESWNLDLIRAFERLRKYPEWPVLNGFFIQAHRNLREASERHIPVYREDVQKAAGESVLRNFEVPAESLPALILSYCVEMPRDSYLAATDFEVVQRMAADVYIGSAMVLKQAQTMSPIVLLSHLHLLRDFESYFGLANPVFGYKLRWYSDYLIEKREIENLIQLTESELVNDKKIPKGESKLSSFHWIDSVADGISRADILATGTIHRAMEIYNMLQKTSLAKITDLFDLRNAYKIRKTPEELISALEPFEELLVSYRMNLFLLDLCRGEYRLLEYQEEHGRMVRAVFDLQQIQSFTPYRRVTLSVSPSGAALLLSERNPRSSSWGPVATSNEFPESVLFYGFPGQAIYLKLANPQLEPFLSTKVKALLNSVLRD